MSNYGLGCPRLPPQGPSVAACTWSTSPGEYKQLQEVAYDNPDGAGIWATYLLVLVTPATVCFQQLVADAADKYLSAPAAWFIGEFASAVLPMTIAYSTPHTGWLALVNLLGVSAALAVEREKVLTWPRRLNWMRATRAVRKEGLSKAYFSIAPGDSTNGSGMPRFVAEFRALTMISTCVGILAVDFPSVFPRSHAKTEAYGFSLMDLGTGTVICNSAVSYWASGKAALAVRGGGVAQLIVRRVRRMLPLLVVGLVRLVVLRGIDYHAPTSEYGVHWNFFFTLFVVAVAGNLPAVGWAPSVMLGFLVLAAYQATLNMGLADYILQAPRTDLFSANREGILGCVGFLGIHWISAGIGAVIANNSSSGDGRSAARKLLLISATSMAAVAVLEFAGMPPSRRMCNMGYAFAVVGCCSLGLGLMAMIDLYWPWARRPPPNVYAGIHASTAETFLIANLLTGLVNVALQPLLLPPWIALQILAAYSFAWSAPVGMLRARGQTVRQWVAARFAATAPRRQHAS